VAAGFAPDARQLIQAISRGELALKCVRNRDLRRLCFAQPATIRPRLADALLGPVESCDYCAHTA
jgi:hypothetical protein